MSYFSCDRCFAKAERHVERLPDEGTAAAARRDKRKKLKGATFVYPRGTTGELRSHRRHLQLATRSGPSSDGKKGNDFFGVKTPPTFITETLPDLDIVTSIVVDWMHNVCEGESKLMTVSIKNFV